MSGEYRYRFSHDTVHVVIAHGVIALPQEHWSMSGFGTSIDPVWLLEQRSFPAGRDQEHRLQLAVSASIALDAYHTPSEAALDGHGVDVYRYGRAMLHRVLRGFRSRHDEQRTIALLAIQIPAQQSNDHRLVGLCERAIDGERVALLACARRMGLAPSLLRDVEE